MLPRAELNEVDVLVAQEQNTVRRKAVAVDAPSQAKRRLEVDAEVKALQEELAEMDG